MQIDVNITSDVIENDEDILTFLNTLIVENLNKIFTAIDASEISAKLALESESVWEEFVSNIKSDLTKSVEENAKKLVREAKVEEETDLGKTESTDVSRLSLLLEKYLSNAKF